MGLGREHAVFCVGTVAAIGLLTAPGFAGVQFLAADQDNTLYEDPTGSLSNGSGDAFFAGKTGTGSIRRGVVRFELPFGLPSNAVITSTSVSMFTTRAISNAAVSLHRAQSDWGEGASDAGSTGGQGDTAQPGDATWLHTFYNTATWTNEGGDFVATASATSPVHLTGAFTI